MAKALAEKRPSYLSDTAPEGYTGQGQEDITTDDIIIPRIKLAQALTPEVVDKKAEEGDLIHNVTGDIICKAGQKLRFIPIMYTKEFIIWRERETGGGILARAIRKQIGTNFRYAWITPNVELTDKIGGKVEVTYKLKRYTTSAIALVDHETDDLSCWKGDEAPAANLTHNYLVVLPDNNMELIAISLSRTSARKGAQLNTMLKMGGASIFTRVFEASTFIDQSDKYKFANWIFSPAGYIAPDQVEMLESLKKLHEDFKATSFVVNVEDGGETESSDSGEF